jgi:hypothetical protein
MPGDTSMYWDITSVMVEVGGTATATYTGDQPNKEQLDTLLNGKATAEVSSGVVTFTGVSAGEVNIPSYSFVAPSVYSENAITISVTAPTEDESYLNKRGLTHFWENIDDIKQDKLTAGSGISITGNTISTTANTFASYSNGTLYITNVAQNADTENF